MHAGVDNPAPTPASARHRCLPADRASGARADSQRACRCGRHESLPFQPTLQAHRRSHPEATRACRSFMRCGEKPHDQQERRLGDLPVRLWRIESVLRVGTIFHSTCMALLFKSSFGAPCAASQRGRPYRTQSWPCGSGAPSRPERWPRPAQRKRELLVRESKKVKRQGRVQPRKDRACLGRLRCGSPAQRSAERPIGRGSNRDASPQLITAPLQKGELCTRGASARTARGPGCPNSQSLLLR